MRILFKPLPFSSSGNCNPQGSSQPVTSAASGDNQASTEPDPYQTIVTPFVLSSFPPDAITSQSHTAVGNSEVKSANPRWQYLQRRYKQGLKILTPLAYVTGVVMIPMSIFYAFGIFDTKKYDTHPLIEPLLKSNRPASAMVHNDTASKRAPRIQNNKVERTLPNKQNKPNNELQLYVPSRDAVIPAPVPQQPVKPAIQLWQEQFQIRFNCILEQLSHRLLQRKDSSRPKSPSRVPQEIKVKKRYS